ncbi:hypothetical protein M9H77_02412 [Catharanthus roseus]|uniref:Uncharacterized protein n=1 Tax=Catharanthus roseus TaxID=4058 RepID=A0ACC0C8A2_CATRO|nr:hypothetical protein M9H77_02412 [Catharanthus roseus]
MYNFHHGGSSGFNVYGGNNTGNGRFTAKRHNGVGNFSSYAKSFEQTSYNDYGGKEHINAKRCGEKQFSMPRQRGAKVETSKTSIIEKFSNANEYPLATIEVEEVLYYMLR